MSYEPSWRVRRRVIVSTLLFCAGETIYLTGWATDTELARTIANGIIILAGSVIGAYVFGAVWDSKNVLAMGRSGRQRVQIDTVTDPAEPVEDPTALPPRKTE